MSDTTQDNTAATADVQAAKIEMLGRMAGAGFASGDGHQSYATAKELAEGENIDEGPRLEWGMPPAAEHEAQDDGHVNVRIITTGAANPGCHLMQNQPPLWQQALFVNPPRVEEDSSERNQQLINEFDNMGREAVEGDEVDA